MSFPLLLVPLVALREVIKSMDMLELLIFPLLSKKCHQILKASISKKSALEITFAAETKFMTVEIAPKFTFDVKWNDRVSGRLYKIGDNFVLMAHLSTCNRCVKLEWIRSGQAAEDEESIKTVLNYFVDTIKPLVSFKFNEELRHEFAMELIRHCRQQHIRLFCITFKYGYNASPENVRELLEGSTDEDERLVILSFLPKEFKYTPPPGGFKLQSVYLSYADWVNLDDFLQCGRVSIRGDLFYMTPQYLNNIFKTIVNTECRIRFLSLSGISFNQDNYPEIMEGLSDRPLEDKGLGPCVELKARNGRKTTIYFLNGLIHLDISYVRQVRTRVKREFE
ncbi:unnamed protein product [Caenorhabditis brenneri]